MITTYRNVRADKSEHVAVAERVLGKRLPLGAVVHHVNQNKRDNRNENLVICPSHAYHMLIHQRMRTIEAGYPAHWRKCQYCKLYDEPDKLKIFRRANKQRDTLTSVYHDACHAEHRRKTLDKDRTAHNLYQKQQYQKHRATRLEYAARRRAEKKVAK